MVIRAWVVGRTKIPSDEVMVGFIKVDPADL